MKNTVEKLSIFLFAVALSTLFSWSCSKANEADLRQNSGATDCDTVNMTYLADVQPILAANCYSCHGDGPVVQAGVNLEAYETVKAQAENGNLIGTITHASGYPAMPFNLPKLSDCSINKIRDWVNRGAEKN